MLARLCPPPSLPQSDALGDGFADAELQAYRHATLGTKLKNLATGKSQAERHQAKAAKDKLVRRSPVCTGPTYDPSMPGWSLLQLEMY